MDLYSFAGTIEAEAIAWRREIHERPELSNKEVNTSAFVAEKLMSFGIETTLLPGKNGVIGLLRGAKAGKTIALRADMDALPLQEDNALPFCSKVDGVAHVCGHDIHTAVLLGCAKALSALRDKIVGNVKFLFQPAEEGLKGAKDMIAAGALQNPAVDAIVALHCWPEIPAGTIGIKHGGVMASSDSVDITIYGRAGHAAHPHKSIDPIIISAQVLTSLQTLLSREIAPVDPAVLTIGKISGGTARNIIAADVLLEGTVRTISPALREKMPAMIGRIAEKTAESMNGRAEVSYSFGTPPLVNDEALLTKAEEAVIAVLGEGAVCYLTQPSMGSEDFAFYTEKTPGILLRLGTANTTAESQLALHNPKIIFDESAIVTGIRAVSQIACSYLQESQKER